MQGVAEKWTNANSAPRQTHNNNFLFEYNNKEYFVCVQMLNYHLKVLLNSFSIPLG